MGTKEASVAHEAPESEDRKGASEGTVIASLVHAVVEGAAAMGLDRQELFRTLGFVDRAPTPDGDRIPYPRYAALWHHVTERVADPFFGLHLAEKVAEAETFSVVGFAARASETFGQAIERVIRFSRVLNETTETRLTVDGSLAIVTDGHRDPAELWPPQKAEFIHATFVVLGQRWTGRVFHPVEVRFQHTSPPDTSEHARLFGCPVHFGRAHNQLVFDKSVLDFRIRHFEPRLCDFLDRHAAEMMPPSTRPRRADEEVRRVVTNQLPSGQPSLERVARQIGMSARTLQRRLEENGHTFASMIDEVRRELAERLLDEHEASMGEIAILLGFSETKAFRRAFQRWTGQTPGAWRDGRSARVTAGA